MGSTQAWHSQRGSATLKIVSSLITGAKSSVMRRASGNDCSGNVGGVVFLFLFVCFLLLIVRLACALAYLQWSN